MKDEKKNKMSWLGLFTVYGHVYVQYTNMQVQYIHTHIHIYVYAK